jgi:hypothetical protein
MNSTRHSNFKAKRVTRNFVQTIQAQPSVVHSLICPVKEAEWLDGWDYDLIFSDSGLMPPVRLFLPASLRIQEWPK